MSQLSRVVFQWPIIFGLRTPASWASSNDRVVASGDCAWRAGFGRVDSRAGAGDVVTYLGAVLVAIVVGWVVDALFQPYLGTGATLILSFVISTVAFFMARRWLNDLRHG